MGQASFAGELPQPFIRGIYARVNKEKLDDFLGKMIRLPRQRHIGGEVRTETHGSFKYEVGAPVKDRPSGWILAAEKKKWADGFTIRICTENGSIDQPLQMAEDGALLFKDKKRSKEWYERAIEVLVAVVHEDWSFIA